MTEPRWILRLGQFGASVAGVHEAVVRMAGNPDDELIVAGTIQRFENAWEQGWKLMRDFLRWGGAPVEVPVPVNVIRAGFQAGLIDDGDLWVAAMKDRNLMSHVYDAVQFRLIGDRIAGGYLAMFGELRTRMERERVRAGHG